MVSTSSKFPLCRDVTMDENHRQLIDDARNWALEQMETTAGHDVGHIRRVVANARRLAAAEGADPTVVELAAWFHDIVNLPKDHPDRSQASTRSAQAAADWLQGRLDDERIELVAESVRCHSFSAGFVPESPEAKVVSDADNLDAIGAVGVARCFEIGGALRRPMMAAEDPFCSQREPDDSTYTVDHFYTKLLKLEDWFYTDSGRANARERIAFMKRFLAQMERETGRE